MRFYRKIQVSESDLTALAKRKQYRYFPVVIQLGATVLVKDNIIARTVDLADEGIEIQLKWFRT